MKISRTRRQVFVLLIQDPVGLPCPVGLVLVQMIIKAGKPQLKRKKKQAM